MMTARLRRRRRPILTSLIAVGSALLLSVAPLPAGADPLPTDPTAPGTVVPVPTDLTSAPAAANGLVVKLRTGHTLTELTSAYPIQPASTLLASRGIYLVQPLDLLARTDVSQLSALATTLAGSAAVEYAEPNWLTILNSNRYHSWPEGQPSQVDGGASTWRTQPALTDLDLSDVHRVSGGLGVKVAVLDTGVDPTHTALLGRLKGGWDDIDDDAVPTDVLSGRDSNGNGIPDDAYGHGTFVAGLLGLVAPDARIMPYRVLDSDGVGNVYVVAQAVLDAADAGAKVINISFGTDQPQESQVMSEAIRTVQSRGVIVVAAAGNDGSTAIHYPAADPGVLAVTATDHGALTSWANRGNWVDVAAPGADVVGPVPGGVYANWSGTSMATPIVTGQVALLRARYPTATASQILGSVTATSTGLAGTVNGSVDLLASLKRKPS